MRSIRLESVDQAIDAVKSGSNLLPVGAQTKPLLGLLPADGCLLKCDGLCGITEYEPTEFTFTAQAGTPISEIQRVLGQQNQFLPFDPPFSAEGATLGGAIASGLNGSSSLRFGGARDFVLGIHFVDGLGNLVMAGGKVVKNAAGFDLPKFMVGSYGRFGLLTDLTLKVFPRPDCQATLGFEGEPEQHLEAIRRLIRIPLEMDAIDICDSRLLIRIGGPERTIQSAGQRIESVIGRSPDQWLQDGDEEAALWEDANRFSWQRQDTLLKIPTQLNQVADWIRLAGEFGLSYRVCIGGQLIYVSGSQDDVKLFSERLAAMRQHFLLIRGSQPNGESCRQGIVGTDDGIFGKLSQSIKRALDPNGRFPALGGSSNQNP